MLTCIHVSCTVLHMFTCMHMCACTVLRMFTCMHMCACTVFRMLTCERMSVCVHVCTYLCFRAYERQQQDPQHTQARENAKDNVVVRGSCRKKPQISDHRPLLIKAHQTTRMCISNIVGIRECTDWQGMLEYTSNMYRLHTKVLVIYSTECRRHEVNKTLSN